MPDIVSVLNKLQESFMLDVTYILNKIRESILLDYSLIHTNRD